MVRDSKQNIEFLRQKKLNFTFVYKIAECEYNAWSDNIPLAIKICLSVKLFFFIAKSVESKRQLINSQTNTNRYIAKRYSQSNFTKMLVLQMQWVHCMHSKMYANKCHCSPCSGMVIYRLSFRWSVVNSTKRERTKNVGLNSKQNALRF